MKKINSPSRFTPDSRTSSVEEATVAPAATAKTQQRAPLERIDIDTINSYPPISFPGNIHLINTPEKLLQATLEMQQQEFLGFDTEKRPNFHKGQNHPISLIQLATSTNAYIIQIKKTGVSDQLKEILENEKIKKIGLALNDDMRDLLKLRPMDLKGFIQIDHLAKNLGIIQTGARSLTALYLQKKLSKSVQKSNWSLPHLTEKQLLYAATDAWICLELYPLLQIGRPARP